MATKSALYEQIKKVSILRKLELPDYKTTSKDDMIKIWQKYVNTKQTFYAAVKRRFEKRGLPVPPYRKSTKEGLLKLLKDTARPRQQEERPTISPVVEAKMEKDEKDTKEDRPTRYDQKRLEEFREFKPTPDRKLMRQVKTELFRKIKPIPDKKLMRQVQTGLYKFLPRQTIKKLDNEGDYRIDDFYRSTNIKLLRLQKFMFEGDQFEEQMIPDEEQVEIIIKEILVYLDRSLNRLRVAGKTYTKFSMVLNLEVIKESGEYEYKTISTKSVGTRQAFINELRIKIRDFIKFYGLRFGKIYNLTVIMWKYAAPLLGDNARATAKVFAKYIIVSSKTKTNCLYTSLAICKKHKKYPQLLEISEQGAHARKEAGRLLKREIKDISTGLASYDDIQKCSNHLRRDIKLYDNKFSVHKVFKTNNPPARLRKGEMFYEIQQVRGHCKAMIPRDSSNAMTPNIEDADDEDQKIYQNYILGNEQDEERTTDEIISNKKLPHNFNYNIATYDLETYKDAEGVHVPYALGMAWFEYTYMDEEKEVIRKVKSKGKRNFGEIKEVKKTVTVKVPTTREQKYVIFRGFDCVAQFSNYLMENKHVFKGFTFYAHNGAKFDFKLIFETLIKSEWKMDAKKFVELAGGVIAANIYTHGDAEGETGKISIDFKDSLKLIPGSLGKLCKELKTEHQKLESLINHNDVTRENCLDDPNLELYLRNDVLGLLEVLDIFGKQVYEGTRIDITKCLTGASLSKKMFFYRYYDKEKYPVYTLSDQNDTFIRTGYSGGRVEAFKMGIGTEGNYSYNDFTSLYPYAGTDFLPYGQPEQVDFTRCDVYSTNQYLVIESIDKNGNRYMNNQLIINDGIKGATWMQQPTILRIKYRQKAEKFLETLNDVHLLDNFRLNIMEKKEHKIESKTTEQPTRIDNEFFGFVECYARTIDTKAIPIHSIKKDGRLLFPVLENWTHFIGLPSIEINYDIYEYKFVRGVKFQKARFMRRFFEECFKNKSVAKQEGKLALSNAFKIIANSGYGWWGLKTRDVDGIVVTNTDAKAYRTFLDKNVLINFSNFGDIDINRINKTLNVKDFNVGVASMIASRARLRLWNCLTDMKRLGADIWYVDTDSIISNMNITQYPELMKKYKADGKGVALGTLKNEADEYVEKLIGTRGMEDIKEREGGDIHFDKCIITGLKQYSLIKTFEYNGTIYSGDIVKLKGYSQSDKKLHYSDMEEIAGGLELTQQQVQWKSDKNTFIDEVRPFTIRNKTIKKRFKSVYTKGLVLPCGNVVPLKV